MAALWILILVVTTYVVTIGIIVVGQEVHPLAAFALFGLCVYGSFKLFQARMTRF